MTWGFAHPWLLLLLPVVLLALWWTQRARGGAVTHPHAGRLRTLVGRTAEWISRAPVALRALALAALVVAMAGPRTGQQIVDMDAEGIAIGLVVDISSSMLAEDFYPQNRLAVAKSTVADFVRARKYDRIAMVAFAGEALTQVPLTIDYPVIFRALDQLRVGMLEDGTAIGTAIATAGSRLRDAPGESRVMIVMTDGENNRGQIDPVTAARAAAAFGIKIYTIGVGSEGVAPVPVARSLFGGYQYANIQVHIDEELLTQIAQLSGGQYFRATNQQALDSIYHRIDQLEKTKVQVRTYTDFTPHYFPWLMAGLLLLGIEWALRASPWGRVP